MAGEQERVELERAGSGVRAEPARPRGRRLVRRQFAAWGVDFAGNDVRAMTSATQGILSNRNLIAINQDSLGRQGTPDLLRRHPASAGKTLANGDVAVALFNQGGATTTISTTAAAVGKTGTSFTLLDTWTNATSTTGGAISASVPAHGTVVYRVSGGGTTTIRAQQSGLCLDVNGAATGNGTTVILCSCTAAANQRWTLR